MTTDQNKSINEGFNIIFDDKVGSELHYNYTREKVGHAVWLLATGNRRHKTPIGHTWS